MTRRPLVIAGIVALLLAAPAFAESPDPNARVGADVCVTCHDVQAQSLRHFADHPGVPDCESCHGPGKAHVDGGGEASKIVNPAKLDAKASAKTCLACHNQAHVRGWMGSVHERNDVSCLSCHAIHNEHGRNAGLLKRPDQSDVCFTCHKMQRTRTMMSSHMPLRESKLQCTDCHNPHGTSTRALLVDASVNDNCVRCHDEKRGPNLFEHPPVRENCLNCHDPHGSLHDNLLVAAAPRLCQSCHIGYLHPTIPQTAQSRFVFNRACINCHPAIHGSNHPSGSRLMR